MECGFDQVQSNYEAALPRLNKRVKKIFFREFAQTQLGPIVGAFHRMEQKRDEKSQRETPVLMILLRHSLMDCGSGAQPNFKAKTLGSDSD